MKDNLLEKVEINNEPFYKISESDSLRPFFMSIVSDSNHWMFISSNGGLTAGRKNAQFALFPYYTDDKITESTDTTGSKTIFRVNAVSGTKLWEPFSIRQEGIYQTTQNLYKNAFGNKVIFEEINHDLQLSFKYQWSSSDKYGFIRSCELTNLSNNSVSLEMVDGLQNILPANVGSDLQNGTSNLVDAYKRSELVKDCGLGIYALSAIIVDKAEPSESLKANVIWSLGLDNPTYLLSSRQLKAFRAGNELKGETDVKAEKGAYFVNKSMTLAGNSTKDWMIIADVNKTQSTVVALANTIRKNDNLTASIAADVALGSANLKQFVASVDGLQLTNDHFSDTRHFSNSLFNIMRGGKFYDDYTILKSDFKGYIAKANKAVFAGAQSSLDALADTFSYFELRAWADGMDDPDLKRLAIEYLPLTFSRRHGDPSRPWNVFSINTRSEADGTTILDYQGNWRDIFQNWEALSYSYPPFVESMIAKFLNASTFDGYNPYRVTKDGFDWETIEPDNPWAYIGYWGDHQLIYLLKFLEFVEKYSAGALHQYFTKEIFVYANVPYKIKGHADICKNPKDTIVFDHDLDKSIRSIRETMGADGALIQDSKGSIHRVNVVEKILATLLAKVSNLVPGAGIWLNTQRPEWNDANNALVGNGVSMVTVYYLRRFLVFAQELFANSPVGQVDVSEELAKYFKSVLSVLKAHQSVLGSQLDNKNRKAIVDGLGQAATDYRESVYSQSFSGEKASLPASDIAAFMDICQTYTEDTIKKNLRADKMYHAYNLITIADDEIAVSYLSEMLEGQVAVLSSKMLTAQESIQLLDSMKSSKLFRTDQYSYILYPNKDLPGFLEKNTIPKSAVQSSKLLTKMLADGSRALVEKDQDGNYHFNGDFRNSNDVKDVLSKLEDSTYATMLSDESDKVLQIYEDVFNHKAFTGRSGTFFGYEGLGSIYWHMVSKLLLAVQEVSMEAVANNESPETIGKLLEHYYEINAGIGVHKSPALYGAFSTDPYSHTPGNKGAQQPGMTGQVKEDVLSRFGELGICIAGGQIYFNPCLLRKTEFLTSESIFNYVAFGGEQKTIEVAKDSLCFTYCQVPVIYRLGNENRMEVVLDSGKVKKFDGLVLDNEISAEMISRSGTVSQINIELEVGQLK